ncbi:hypothetical protein ALC62_13798, partial [Cyphomyrmex costatus]
IVPGCTSGYKSNPEKVHFFRVPKDDVFREKWQNAMLRKTAITCKHSVCEKHFKNSDIETKKLLYDSNEIVIGISPYKKMKLKCGVIPSQFPWTEGTEATEATEETGTEAEVTEVIEVNKINFTMHRVEICLFFLAEIFVRFIFKIKNCRIHIHINNINRTFKKIRGIGEIGLRIY